MLRDRSVISLAAQGNLVGLRDVVSLDSPQALANPVASLAQELKRVGGMTLGSRTLQVGLVLFDEVRLKGRSDFIHSFQRVIDGPVS